MILRTLTMKNFRQFRGEQRLAFAPTQETKGKNITVIFGENGRGKTGIFRAVMFCLFGDRRLSQDGEAPTEELSLVNTSALQESEGKSVEAFVELEFSRGSKIYCLRRSLAAMRDRHRTLEELREVRLHQQDHKGNNSTLHDPHEIAKVINGILDSRVREYFLFDGEKIERLTRAGRQQRLEVAKGLKNLLNIDALQSAIEAADILCKKLNSELQKKSTGEHAKILRQINENTDEQKQARDRLTQLDSELALAEGQKDKVDKELEQFKEVRALWEERKTLERSADETEDQIAKLLVDMKGKIGKASLGLVQSTVDKVFTNIDQRKKKGEIPPEIRKDLIEKLIADGTCICGRTLVRGTDPYNLILEWRTKSSDPSLQDSALELWRHLSAIRSRHGDLGQGAEAVLTKYGQARQSLLRIRSRLEAISKEIGTSVRDDAGNLEGHRRKIEKSMIHLEAEKVHRTQKLEDLANEYERLQARRKELERDENIRNALVQRVELATQTRNALAEVFKGFTGDIKQQIGKDATSILGKLLDEEGRRSLCEIVVNDDYSLQMLDRWHNPFLANISAGQRQIMSVSFIAALARAAAGGATLEMPLFMDTPFGRLSYDHRRNLIREIPKLCTQWILLATDTELRRQEGNLLRTGGHWGRFYLLKSTEDGNTQVEERKLSDALSLLQEIEEDVA